MADKAASGGGQNESYAKPKTDDEWVSYVDERVKDGTNWTERRQIMVNVNYFVGNQWITWNDVQKQVTTAPNPKNQERITHNALRPRVMTKLAKQTKNRIKYDVTPDTNSQERIDTAKAATKYLHYWWNQQDMDRKTRDVHLNDNVKGWCAVKTFLDTEKGQDITPDDSEEPLHTGEVVARVVDSLCLYVDPAATNDDEIRWMVEETPRDVGYIQRKYKKSVSPDPNVNYFTSYDVTSATGSESSGNKRNKNMAMVRELWMAPCADYPNGAKVTTAGNTFLDFDDNAGEIPYVIFGDLPIPGTVKYQSFLQDMLPIQRTINIAKTMLATHMKRMGNTMWAIPIGSAVDEDMLTDEEGGMFYFNGQNGQPMRMPPVDVPGFFDRIIEFATRDLDDMSGAREIATGRLPAGLDTASGLSLMVEQENEKLAVTAQNYERGMKKVLNRVLRLMQKHYTEERQAEILGPDNEIELISFRGADLSGGEDVNIVQGSSLPEMKSAQEDRIMTLWQAGAITDKNGQPDHNAFLRLMGMGDSTELFEQNMLDENKAKMENKTFEQIASDSQMAQAVAMWMQQREQVQAQNKQIAMEAQNNGIAPDAVQQLVQPEPPPPPFLPKVRDFQDHDIHLYVLNNFRKSNAYDKLPPELQQLVDAHAAEHEQMIAQSAQSMPAPPEVQAQQQQNDLKQQELQQKSQESAAKNQIEVMKIQADQQKTAMQLNQTSQMARENHDRTIERETINSMLNKDNGRG